MKTQDSNDRVIIEPAKESDYEDMLKLMKTVNMHHIPSPEMPELDWKCCFIAKVGAKIVGAAGYKIISPKKGKTTLMAVYPEFRRFGIGRQLQERRMLAMSDAGIETLITNADIPETIDWYKKHFGYRKVGKLKKLHEFGRQDIDEWTTLETDLRGWRKKYDKQ
jgi:ribosomal-protein-alanine N-acetyltransferase